MGREVAVAAPAPAPTALAPGFRFHPTDEELVIYYLKRKVCRKPFKFNAISDVDVYKSEPWDLSGKSSLKSRDQEYYFFSALDKKYGNGARMNRATSQGYWKATGNDRPVKHNNRTVGMKKTLVFHSGRAPDGKRTNWVMHEYRLVEEEMQRAGVGTNQDPYVLCRVFHKSNIGPPNGHRYAPFVEEEWDDDKLALVPGAETRDEVVAGRDAFVGGNGHAACIEQKDHVACIGGNGHGAFVEGNGCKTIVEGNSHGAIDEGNGDGTIDEGNGDGTINEGNDDGTNNEGNGHGTINEGSGHETINDEKAHGTINEGNGHDTHMEANGHNVHSAGNFEQDTRAINNAPLSAAELPKDNQNVLPPLKIERMDDFPMTCVVNREERLDDYPPSPCADDQQLLLTMFDRQPGQLRQYKRRRNNDSNSNQSNASEISSRMTHDPCSSTTTTASTETSVATTRTRNFLSALVEFQLLESLEPKDPTPAPPPEYKAAMHESSVPPSCVKFIESLQSEIHKISIEKETLKFEMMSAQAMINILQSRIELLNKENEDLKRGRPETPTA